MIYGICHVAFAVRDIEKSLNFYEKILGFKRVFHLERDGNIWFVFLKIAEEQYLEIFLDNDISHLENKSYRHFCINTNDIFKDVEEIKNKGWNIDIEPFLGIDGNYQAFLRDPDGNVIELMQILPDSLLKRSEKLC
jgi:lactoylglutathione lyase